MKIDRVIMRSLLIKVYILAPFPDRFTVECEERCNLTPQTPQNTAGAQRENLYSSLRVSSVLCGAERLFSFSQLKLL
jgi:hypothetical protein